MHERRLLRRRWRSDERGFTLADLLVGMTIAAIAGAGAVSFIRSQSLAMRVQAGQTDLNDSSRGAVEFMAREIRLAGYWPCGKSNQGGCPGACQAAGWGIVAGATPTLLRIQYDLSGNGAIETTAAASEDVTYQYDAANQKVQRVAGTGANSSTSDLATDVPANGFGLAYYDLNNNAIVPGGGGLTAAQAAAVKRVSIRLEPAKTPDARLATTQAKASLWTNVLLENYAKCQ